MSLLLYVVIHFAAGLLGWLWAEVRGPREDSRPPTRRARGGPQMSHGSAAARDIALGRRGGRWADDFDGPTTDGPPCVICRQPMIVGQRGVHLECCAATGGRDGGGTVCGRCWKAA